ncbi:MAG: sugar transporter permease [Chloroflexi bacterium]|jgi:multiple sugar transport system permease protein|nr:sugar transporter permease [Chloroflexota bacterium]
MAQRIEMKPVAHGALPYTGPRARKSQVGTRLRAGGRHVLLVIISLVFVAPLLWMLSSSLKTNTDIFIFPPHLLPTPPMWANYPNALNYIPFWHYTWNTLIITVASVAGTLFACPAAAYAFARLHWRGRNFFFALSLSTIMLPFLATMVPLFVIFRQLNVIDTFWPLILPAFGGNPLYIFLLRQFFLGIPRELSEAAHIDGASEFTIFRRIILPLSKPALATVSLFTFLANWKDFLAPLIFLQSSDLYTLSLGLQQYQSLHQTAWGYLMAASVVFVLPVAIVFFAAQRFFIQGIALTGVKA